MTNSNVRILVVDDEPPIRKLLRVGLGSQGYAISEAPNARVAIELMEAEKPDLVLLDLGLPGMGGHELLRKWRDDGLDIPVVILSSRTDEAGIVNALELGADDYVTKPFGMNELVARIRVALRHKFQQQGEKPVFHTGDLSRRSGQAHRQGRRQGRQAVAKGIRHIAHPGAARRQGPDPPFPVEAGLGRFDRRAVSQGLCPPAAAEDREDPDQPRYITTETGVGYRLREVE